jgi:hypothetical protein
LSWLNCSAADNRGTTQGLAANDPANRKALLDQ